ncbi:DUF4401 domain-containing protein [Muricauda sp. JGD-17]|uniref:DUF4401 domain-containing protein n=1 Tax=Flagellimonas ochracea TaxID=2696472 RepID=A0A964TDX3_9FLAO|nr:DUF4401 domain-containing protein [Allomuricauda ochracea]NAY91696.1 DUF4401 domain-containing protein [Allomuricauda ochracea]
MGELENNMRLLQKIRSEENDDFKVDEDAVFTEYQKRRDNKANLAIKILSIFGGLLSSLGFLGFLMILGIYNSTTGMFVVGLGFIIGAIMMTNRFEKLIIDTFGVSCYILGFSLFVVALFSFDFREDDVLLMVIVLALITLFLVKNYVLSFISMLTVGVCFILLIISNDVYEVIHVYTVLYAVGLTFFVLEEGSLMAFAPRMLQLYDPLRIGFIFSFLFGLLALGKEGLIPVYNGTLWISSLVIILLTLYMIRSVLLDFGETQKKGNIGFFF